MGRVSKVHASPIVSLCKERKEIIKAAKYCRYDLVTSFVVYMDSLSELGNALNQYVEQEFVTFDDCCAHLEISSNDTDFNLDSSSPLCQSHCDEEEPISLHHSPALKDDESRYTCKHHVDVAASYMDRNNMKNTSQTPSNLSSNNSHHSNYENTNIHMLHKDFGHHENSPMMMETPSGHWFSHRYEHYGAKPFPVVVSSNYVAESQKHGTNQNNAATVSPIPPPPQVANWDFLFPFSMNYNNVPYYDHDHDVREIREREWIPDLEDEIEQSSTVPVYYQNEMESEMRHGDGTPNVAGLNANNEDSLSTKSEEIVVWRETTEGKKGTTTQDSESESLGTSSVTTPVSSMSLKEAVLDIKNEFKHLFDCGKEFSSIIEVGKLPYHSVSCKLRAFVYCVLGQIIPSLRPCLYPSYMLLHQPAPRTRMLSKAVKHKQNNIQHFCTTSSDLSSTLEKLYVWEKRLYGEVVGEEKLRIPYDKQYKRLKKLDFKGSESDKINDALASIKLLDSEINVAVASISVISRQINELRDNKLLPELNKLIEGLIRLWKVMSTCHQKQFQAISKAISHVHILDRTNKKKSSLKATLRLERMILNWGMCFSNFINSQKALVKHLNDWLLRCIHQKAEESDLEAPSIFGVCNNWYNAIDKISEIEVSKAISNFALSLHQLYVKLEEEKALKVRVKYLLKDYQHRLKSYCKKNGINSQDCSSFFKMRPSEHFVEVEIPLLRVSGDNLATSRQRLIEQRKRHQEVIQHANDVASSCLQEGLTPIFDALRSFSLENLKIYEQLKLPILC